MTTMIENKIQLPNNAEIFIKSKFIKAEVIYIETINEMYKVELNNGINITFDNEGNWCSINSEYKLPDNIIPEVVQKKVSKIKRFETEYKYDNLDVNEIRKIINSYRIVLDHYLEFHVYGR